MRRTLKTRAISALNCVSNLWTSKTVKTNIEATMWLPGVKKELKALGKTNSHVIEGVEIQGFELTTTPEFAQARRWSLATRIALIERGCFVLIEDLSTLDELEAMIKRESIVRLPEDVWVKALRRRTPSKDKISLLVSTITNKTLAHIVEHVSSVFNDLSADRIDALLPSDPERVKHWLLFNLSKADPKRWTLPLLAVLLDECAKKDRPAIMDSWLMIAVDRAFNNKLDISSLMPRIYKEQASLYDKITTYCSKDENWEFARPIILNWMPQLLPLVKEYPSPFDEVITHSVKSNEPAILLKIAYRHVDSPEVHQVLLDNLAHIVRAEKNFVSALNNKLLYYATNEKQYYRVIWANQWKNFHDVTEGNFKLLKTKVFNSKATDIIVQYFFPFTGWDTTDIKAAIRILIGQDKFPVAMIGELASDMQEYAYQTMRTRAQALVINSDDMNQIKALLAKRNLTVEAEQILLKRVVSGYDMSFENMVVDYIATKKLDPSSFVFMTKCQYGSLRLWLRYLTTYASKHGLTQTEFSYLMQGSAYPEQAIHFEGYLK